MLEVYNRPDSVYAFLVEVERLLLAPAIFNAPRERRFK